MSDGEGIGAGNLLNQGMHQVGGNDHVNSGKDGSQDNELCAAQTGIYTGSNEYVGEPVQHVTGQEHGLILGEAGKQQVDGKADDHNNADLGAVQAADIHRGGRNGLGHNGAESSTYVGNGTGHDADALVQNKVTNGGHKGAADNLRCGLLLEQQANQCNQGNKNGALSEDLFDNKVKNSVHTITS